MRLFLFSLCVLIVGSAPVFAADPALCLRCHSSENSIAPDLSGRPRADIVAAVREFRIGRRNHPIMRSFSQSLTDQDVASLADYFAKRQARASEEAPPR